MCFHFHIMSTLNDVIKTIVTANSPPVPNAFTRVLYVGASGDNTDGSSWAKAYTTLSTALAIADIVGEIRLIIIGPGTYNITNSTTIGYKLCLYASIRGTVIINSTVASPAVTFNITNDVLFDGIKFTDSTSAKTVDIQNTGINTLRNCIFDLNDAVAGSIAVNSVAPGLIVEDCQFIGRHAVNVAHRGLVFDACWYGIIKNCIFRGFSNQIELNNGANYYTIENCVFEHVYTGMGTAPNAIVLNMSDHLTVKDCAFEFGYYNGCTYILQDVDVSLDLAIVNCTFAHNSTVNPNGISAPVTATTGAAAHEWGASIPILTAGVYYAACRIKYLNFYDASIADEFFFEIWHKGHRWYRGSVPQHGYIEVPVEAWSCIRFDNAEIIVACTGGGAKTIKVDVGLEVAMHAN
jgi:hypothetical protein